MTNIFHESYKVKCKSYPELRTLAGYHDFQRNVAQNRYLLIKEYEQALERESRKSAGRFLKGPVLQKFCEENNINSKTFYSYLGNYKKNGILSLLPKWGHMKGTGFFDNIDIESIRKYIDQEKGYAQNYRILASIFKRKGVVFPSYDTFRRAAISNRLIECRANGVEKASLEKKTNSNIQIKRKTILNQKKPAACNINFPEYFRIINKKALNLAFYHYATILPFLDPRIDLKKKRKLIDEISSRVHHPLPGMSIRIGKSTVYAQISGVKKHGFEYLIPKRAILRTRKIGNKIKVKIEIDLNKPLSLLTEIKSILKAVDPPYSQNYRSAIKFVDFMIVRPAGRTHLEVQVLYTPNRGKC